MFLTAIDALRVKILQNHSNLKLAKTYNLKEYAEIFKGLYNTYYGILKFSIHIRSHEWMCQLIWPVILPISFLTPAMNTIVTIDRFLPKSLLKINKFCPRKVPEKCINCSLVAVKYPMYYKMTQNKPFVLTSGLCCILVFVAYDTYGFLVHF